MGEGGPRTASLVWAGLVPVRQPVTWPGEGGDPDGRPALCSRVPQVGDVGMVAAGDLADGPAAT